VFPVPDYSIPKDREAFLGLVQTVAQGLRSGERVLIHCGAGIGRTGTPAVSVLMALGMAHADAHEAVSDAGSGPETSGQEELAQWVAEAM